MKRGRRVAKVLARAGLCSRREAERWISQGRVSVDGRVLDSAAINVPPGAEVRVDGKPLPEALPPRLWRFHKPRGVLTTARDPEGRPTVFERLPPDLPRVVAVGRLDMDSEGLLLLTNDGDLARHMELPKTGWLRRYRVRVLGRVDEARLAGLSRGMSVRGARYGPIHAALERQTGANAWLTVSLREGKNREVRHVMAHLGYVANRLIRVGYGPFSLGDLARGKVEEVPGKVVRRHHRVLSGARGDGDVPAAAARTRSHADRRR